MNEAEWRVNTPSLLDQIVNCTPGAEIFRIPLNILGRMLAEVGERAAELNDPKLNALMVRLAIYSVGDPYSPDYNETIVNEVLAAATQRTSDTGDNNPTPEE